MSLVTIFALFGDDLRIWFTTKDSDPYFYAGLSLSFLLFTIEVLINSCVVDDFKYSFFFWLDIIATLSLITDIGWVIEFI
jgi:TM2 domain-containing membrane protein YozV